MKSFFIGGKKATRRLFFHLCLFFGWFVIRINTKTKGKDFLETLMEDGSGSRIEPVNFWCRSRNFFSFFQIVRCHIIRHFGGKALLGGLKCMIYD